MNRFTSRFNLPLLTARSALEKSILRGRMEETSYYISELDLAGYGKYVFSSLIYFAASDVSLADPKVVSYIMCLYEKWIEKLDLAGLNHRESSQNASARNLLMAAGLVLAEARKCRIVWHAQILLPLLHYEKTTDLLSSLQALDKALAINDECQALYYVNRIHIFTDIYKDEIKRNDGFKEDAFLSFRKMWDVFERYIDPSYESILSTLWDIVKNDKLKWKWNLVFMIYAVFLITRKPKVSPVFEIEEPLLEKVTTEMYGSIPEIEIPDYVFDRFTKEGIKQKRGVSHYFNVSSKIVNVGYPDDYRDLAFEYELLREKEGGKISRLRMRGMIREDKYQIEVRALGIAQRLQELCQSLIVPAAPEKVKAEKSCGKIRVGQHRRAKRHPTFPDFENVNITSRGPQWSRELSPFLLGPVEDVKSGSSFPAQNMENFWQFLKVYEEVPRQRQKKRGKVIYEWPKSRLARKRDGRWEILEEWYRWRDHGFQTQAGIRHPAGTKVRPIFSFYNNERLGYIPARKKIYLPTYVALARKTNAYSKLLKLLKKGRNLMLIDVDGPPLAKYPQGLEVDLDLIEEKLNDPSHPFGHGYALASALLRDCQSSSTESKEELYSSTEPLESYKVLICGDRNWNNEQCMIEVMEDLPPDSIIIEGECRGADLMAKRIAQSLNLQVLPFPADWQKYGKSAGPIRNRKMLNEGKPDLVIAFHPDIENSKGTKGMKKLAENAGVKVIVITGDEPSEMNVSPVIEKKGAIKFGNGRSKKYGFLSNSYPLKCLEIDGKKYETVEHYIQSIKFANLSNRNSWYEELIRTVDSPAKAIVLGEMDKDNKIKELNRSIHQAREDGISQRSDWDNVKDKLMYKCLRAKFSQNPILLTQLKATAPAQLVFHCKDKYWGDGGISKDGQNNLGKALIRIRDKLKSKKSLYSAALYELSTPDDCLGPTLNSHWIIPGRLLAGAYPGNRDKKLHSHLIKTLLEADINVFISLMEKKESKYKKLRSYEKVIVNKFKRGDIEFYNYEIPDMGITTDKILLQIVDHVVTLLNEGKNVYLHCLGGVGRTGTVVAVLIAKLFNKSAKDALVLTNKLYKCRSKDKRRRSPQTTIQNQQVFRVLDEEAQNEGEINAEKKEQDFEFKSNIKTFDLSSSEVFRGSEGVGKKATISQMNIPGFKSVKVIVKGPLNDTTEGEIQCHVDTLKDMFNLTSIGCVIMKLKDGNFLVFKSYGDQVIPFSDWKEEHQPTDILLNKLIQNLFFRFILGLDHTDVRNMLVIKNGYDILSINETHMFIRSPVFKGVDDLFSHKPARDIHDLVSNEIKRYQMRYIKLLKDWQEKVNTLEEEENEREINERLTSLMEGIKRI